MLQFRRVMMLAGVAGVLAACAAPITTPPQVNSYSPSLLSYVAKRGGMRTEIYGNPFGADQAQVNQAVLRSLEEGSRGPHFPFYDNPPADFKQTAYHVVVAFGSDGPQGYRLCTGPSGGAPTNDGGTVRVSAAFCSGEKVVTSVSGRVQNATGPEDPAFRSLMRQVALALFPSRDLQRDGANGADFDN